MSAVSQGAWSPAWTAVCSLEEVLPDSGVAALVAGHEVAVFRVADAVYAIGNRDPASGVNVLGRGIVGDIGGEVVVASPIYKQHYSLLTGQCLEDADLAVPAYLARVVDGTIWVRNVAVPTRSGARRRRLVVVGNGMAAMRAIEELLELDPKAYQIEVFGAEPHGGYNRVLLSPFLAGDKPLQDILTHTPAWYEQRGIVMHCGDPIVHIDRRQRRVRSQKGIEAPYDRLLIATGSRPVFLPIPGRELPGVMGFRDLSDVDTMLKASREHRRAVVIGGGLLGLEAANGLRARGMDVTVIHLCAHLMERQLDLHAAQLLRQELERRGIEFKLGMSTEQFLGTTELTGIRLVDGTEIAADLAVVTVGIKPNIDLALAAGLPCGRGILVDDTLQTNDPAIYAVGECVQHRGKTFGLVAPLFEQARVCATFLAQRSVRGYRDRTCSTRLKVAGIDVFSAGDFSSAPGAESLVLRDAQGGIYKRLVIQQDRIRGAILYGDVRDAQWYLDLMEANRDIRELRADLLFRRAARRGRVSGVVLPGVRTTCPYCGVGCGLIVSAITGVTSIRGDPLHPANHGALCSKGSALGETVGLGDRLLRPRINGVEADWDQALHTVAQGFRRAIDTYGPDSVAFYVSGQLLTEDYYVANKLMKGFIGSANIDTNSRLCMSSAVAAHRRAFGEDVVPATYEDLELADLVVLVGSNTAWCHPVLHRRILKAKESRPDMRIVVLDPRRTPTCDSADLHVPVRAGTDVLLFNGLLSYLSRRGMADSSFVGAHTRGAARALLVADNTAGDIGMVARHCGVELSVLQRFYEWFANTQRTVTLFSQGVNQSSSGTDKANSIINAHLLTGRIGRPGMGPFSITGQPNAMGGREVGGLATTLAAHMEFDNPGHRQLLQQFWNAPTLAPGPGLKAVDLFESMYQGKIKAVWIMATNPVVSLPNADRARRALQNCDFVVVSDVVENNDTVALGHVVLPASAWGEKQGTVTNSDRHISRQRSFLDPAGEVRPDWWMICEVAKRLGYGDAFGYASPAEIFDEHARLSALDNDGARAFNLGGLVGLSEVEYEELSPIQWPITASRQGTARLFSDGRFSHADGKARLIPTRPRAPRFPLDEEYPLVLNTGRIRDQWHTMTRSGRAPRLTSHSPEPFVDMHAADALIFGVREGTLSRVVTRWGSLVARLRTSGEIARGSIFVPIHWSDANCSDARVGAVVNPAVDPISGEPEFKATPARVEPFVVNYYGFILTRHEVSVHKLTWWARADAGQYRRFEIAGRGLPRSWSQWARALLGTQEAASWLDYEDVSTGTYRAAVIEAGRLESCLFVGPNPELPSRAWLGSLFDRRELSDAERRGLLAARPPLPGLDGGASVCACFNVGRRAIQQAIAQGCHDPASIGRSIKAGTNCGSCIPELRRIIADVATPAAQATA